MRQAELRGNREVVLETVRILCEAVADKKKQQDVIRSRAYRERRKTIDLTVQTEAAANILMLSAPAPHPPAAVPEPAPEPADDDLILPPVNN